jgi:diadenylate cyclase
MSLFKYDFITFGLKDLVDVLIVGFIIFQVLKLVKGTRSVQIIIGLTLIAGVAFVAYWFQLEGLTWLYTTLAPFGLLVLVIVFQPELRGVLAQMGQHRYFRRFFSMQQRRSQEEICRAVLRLSELGYGALIVLERNIGLRNFAESGKILRSELSSELLVTLFTPYTPLHDGAVIVAGDHIVAAAASLPLTSDLRYRKLFGMRHKAAIGISELSDAVVVVVSEESQKISIAFEGVLDADIGKTEFRQKLDEYMAR